MSLVTTARNAGLLEMREVLIDQHARKVDLIAPASKLKFREGQLQVAGMDPIIDDAGVTNVNGQYRPTEIFDEGLASKLGIPLGYVRRLRNERPDLYDANANGLLRGKAKLRDGKQEWLFPADERNFMVRTFRPDTDQPGIARAILSDRYAVMDNLDVLTAALDGIERAGVHVEIDGCDLTDRRMYVRIKAPEVQALAPELLKGYRSPFSGESGTDNPTVFAGFVLSNSETGDGAFSITPRMIVQVCNNGMTISKDATRAVHLGSKMEEGTIRWTKDTMDKQLALVTARARDSVATFLDVEYMKRTLRSMTDAAERPLKEVDSVKVITKKLSFDQETQDRVFEMFVRGGQMTAGGVLNALTAAARDTADPDKAHEIESQCVRALELAAAL